MKTRFETVSRFKASIFLLFAYLPHLIEFLGIKKRGVSRKETPRFIFPLKYAVNQFFQPFIAQFSIPFVDD